MQIIQWTCGEKYLGYFFLIWIQSSMWKSNGDRYSEKFLCLHIRLEFPTEWEMRFLLGTSKIKNKAEITQLDVWSNHTIRWTYQNVQT